MPVWRISFTGLAQAGAFDTRRWLRGAILEAAPPEFHIERIVERLRQIVTRQFREDRDVTKLQRYRRRLSVMLAGYWNTTLGCIPALSWAAIRDEREPGRADPNCRGIRVTPGPTTRRPARNNLFMALESGSGRRATRTRRSTRLPVRRRSNARPMTWAGAC